MAPWIWQSDSDERSPSSTTDSSDSHDSSPSRALFKLSDPLSQGSSMQQPRGLKPFDRLLPPGRSKHPASHSAALDLGQSDAAAHVSQTPIRADRRVDECHEQSEECVRVYEALRSHLSMPWHHARLSIEVNCKHLQSSAHCPAKRAVFIGRRHGGRKPERRIQRSVVTLNLVKSFVGTLAGRAFSTTTTSSVQCAEATLRRAPLTMGLAVIFNQLTLCVLACGA